MSVQISEQQSNKIHDLNRESFFPAVSEKMDIESTQQFSSLPRELQDRIFLLLPYIDFVKCREVCVEWKKQIDVLKGIGKGKLTHKQLFDEIEKLANECDQRKIIFSEKKVHPYYSYHAYPGRPEFLEEAKLDHSHALNVFRRLMARKKLLSDPQNYSRLKYDPYVPYIPLSRPVFLKLFQQKVSSFSEDRQKACFTFYPPRTKANELGLLFGGNVFILCKANELQDFSFDPSNVIFNKQDTQIPIFFSKDEIEQLKKRLLEQRIEKKEFIDQMKSESFFYGQLDRKEAVSKLEGYPPGTFLMRPSFSKEYDGFISYTNMNGEILHSAFVVIKGDAGNTQIFFEENGLLFNSFQDLFSYMSPILKNPFDPEIKKEAKEVRCIVTGNSVEKVYD